MTSSLVGSEMCIRDSSLQVRRKASRPYSSRMRRNQKKTSSSHRVATAVSYTHLTLPTICSV
eukprot:11719203-Prorocentrum_lima.AAC.1